MDMFSLTSTPHYSPFPATILAGKHLSATTPPHSFNRSHDFSNNPNPTTPSSSTTSNHYRRSQKPPKPLKPPPPPPKIPIPNNQVIPQFEVTTSPQTLTNKLWLTRKLSPPPPPPTPPPLSPTVAKTVSRKSDSTNSEEPAGIDYRQEGKIFVGNFPLWIKKKELFDFFRQFGPIENVILIKGYNETDQNMGFGFIIYGGPDADKSAMKAVDFDGVEFHGRVLTVKLDDGRRLKGKAEERAKWLSGDDKVDYKSKWHEEREGSRREFRKVLETRPEDWQAVVRAFQNIKKVCLYAY